jgi:Uma2 family endonuclease
MRWCEDRGYHVQAQLPVAVNEISAPEPDVAVIVGALDAYASRHPGPQDVAAVFEVADSSLQYDTTTKRRLYAVAGIPTYWIVNLVDAKVAVNLQPDVASGVYARIQEYRPGDTIRLTIGQDELAIDIAALLA